MGRHHLELIGVDKGKASKPVPLRHADAKGERSYSSDSFLASHYMGVSGQRHAPAVLYYRGKEPRYPLDRRLGGPQLIWTQRLEKKLFSSAGDQTPCRSICSQTL
jgi:hypothetical protein